MAGHVCVRVWVWVCLRVNMFVCVSQKSNGNENNEARFCAHISKAKQKKNKNPRKRAELSAVFWRWGVKGGRLQKKKESSAKLCVVSCWKKIHIYICIFCYSWFFVLTLFTSNPRFWPFCARFVNLLFIQISVRSKSTSQQNPHLPFKKIFTVVANEMYTE